MIERMGTIKEGGSHSKTGHFCLLLVKGNIAVSKSTEEEEERGKEGKER